ncbi:hypothetical protein RCL_jg11062.t1 [Rhizophagus clarus]|uniref:Uncharacterized protein n=1 Tax=Rhizophagus clarus TaxID=94130 RepID=A0A8H3M6C4_9GLOM|nr:hypothetical protein RCL_jg11062.t1 [Rhizophagus clarus]
MLMLTPKIKYMFGETSKNKSKTKIVEDEHYDGKLHSRVSILNTRWFLFLAISSLLEDNWTAKFQIFRFFYGIISNNTAKVLRPLLSTMNKNTFKQYREANRKRQTGKKWNTDLSLEDSVTSMTINLQPIRCLEIVRTMEIRKQIHSDHKINYIWQTLFT